MAEQRVNVYQANWQRSPHVAAMPDGGWIIVYDGYFNEYDDSDLSATYVAARRYDAAGRAQRTETIITAFDDTVSRDARVAVLKDGGYVVTWSFSDEDDILTVGMRTRAQVFNADGSARTAVFTADIAASNDARAPEVVARADGGFTLSWGISTSQGLALDDVRVRHFTASGRPVSGDLPLNTRVVDFDQLVTRSDTLAGGRTVIVWGSEATIDNGGGGINDIRASLFSADGRLLRSDFHLMQTTGSAGYETNDGYDVAALANGGFAVVAENHGFRLDEDLEGRVIMFGTYDASGRRTSLAPILRGIDGAIDYASLTQLDTGEIVVIWATRGPDGGDGVDVFGRLVSAAGTALTGVFEISTNRFSYENQTAPEVAALRGGGFVVTYESESIDADDDGIAMRVFGRGTAAADRLGVDVTRRLSGLGGDDVLTGSAVADALDGGSGSDRLLGLGGNDRLRGGFGAGNDGLNGGAGDDRLAGGAGDDVLNGEGGFDVADFSDATGAMRASLATTAVQRIGGGLGSDRLISIEGVLAGSGRDRLQGSAGANILNGAGGNDTLSGGAGNDRLLGGSGNDIIVAGAGNDLVDGGAGIDRLLFQTQANVRVNLAVTTGQTTHEGTDRLSGIEQVVSDGGRDLLLGSRLANLLSAGAGQDTLSGGAGSDRLDGGAGVDRLTGGTGTDLLIGGAGNDVFVFARNNGADRIADFDSGADRMLIRGGFDFADLTIEAAGSDTRISLAGTRLLLEDVLSWTIDSSDFVFA